MVIQACDNDGHNSTSDTTLSHGVQHRAGNENEVVGLRNFYSHGSMGDNKASGGVTNQKRVSGEDHDPGNAIGTSGVSRQTIPDESRKSGDIGQEDNKRLCMASKPESRSDAFSERGPDSSAQGSGQTGCGNWEGRLCQPGSRYSRGWAEINCQVAAATSSPRIGESGGSGSGGGSSTQPDVGESHGGAVCPGPDSGGAAGDGEGQVGQDAGARRVVQAAPPPM